MSLDIVSVSTAISALSVTGLIVADLDEIPTSLTERNTPLLIPDPINPISGLNMIELSFGSGTNMARNAKYTLNYILIGYPVGQGRSTVIESFKTTVNLVISFCNAVTAANTLGAAMEWEVRDPRRATNFTQAGVTFHAWNISIDVTEIL